MKRLILLIVALAINSVGCSPSQQASYCPTVKQIAADSATANVIVEKILATTSDPSVKQSAWTARWYLVDSIAETLIPTICPDATAPATQPTK